MPEYTAKTRVYSTIQGDVWDLVALAEYGDEHAMHYVQDANFYERFTSMFVGGVKLDIPFKVKVENNLKVGKPIVNIQKIMPWRT